MYNLPIQIRPKFLFARKTALPILYGGISSFIPIAYFYAIIDDHYLPKWLIPSTVFILVFTGFYLYEIIACKKELYTIHNDKVEYSNRLSNRNSVVFLSDVAIVNVETKRKRDDIGDIFLFSKGGIFGVTSVPSCTELATLIRNLIHGSEPELRR